jgi:hypothetical protein
MADRKRAWPWIAAGALTAGAVTFFVGQYLRVKKERRWRTFLGIDATTEELQDSYVEYLRREVPNNVKSFLNLKRESPEASLAETVVFGILRQLRLNPVVSDVYAGGADFECTYRPIWFADTGSQPLVVEVTTLEPSAVERNSGWPIEAPSEISGGPFSLLTDRIAARASDKVPQLSKPKMPRVLAIVSSHIGADALLSNELAAKAVLVSNPQITQPIGGGPASQTTDLRDSVFLRVDPVTGKVIARRQSISAVLLVSVSGRSARVLGVLHPEPRYPLNIDSFPDIPFIKVRPWPVVGRQIELGWVLGQPSRREFKHHLIR